MKFLQLFTVGRAGLEATFQRIPGVEKESARHQAERIWELGLSSGHLYAPYLQPIGYDANFVVANCRSLQLAWVRERGIELRVPKSWIYEVAWHQINSYAPDVLFINDPPIFDSRFLRTLKVRPEIIIGWHSSSIPQGADWSEFDILLSSSAIIRQVALQLGAKTATFFLPGFERRAFHSVKDEPIDCDLVFSSNTFTPDARNLGLLENVLTHACGAKPEYTCDLHINELSCEGSPSLSKRNKGASFGIDHLRALRSGRMVLGISGTSPVMLDAISGRSIVLERGAGIRELIIEAAGVGRLPLVEHYEYLNRYFERGSEIETFHSQEELIEKVRYLAEHPNVAEEMAARAQTRCLREHVMETRAAQFHELVQSYLRRRTLHLNRRGEMEVALRKAKELLDATMYEDALEMLDWFITEPYVIKDLFRTRAEALAGMGCISDAIDEVERELLIYPDNLKARTFLSSLLKQLSPSSNPVQPDNAEVTTDSPALPKEVLSDLLG